MTGKPLPEITDINNRFWDSVQQNKFELPYCVSCNKPHYPPSSLCPHCLSDDIDWREASGNGTVYSWVIYHQKYHNAFENEMPYNVAIIDLDEGARMVSQIIDCPNEEIYIGMPVTVTFKKADDEFIVPVFRKKGK